MDLEHARALISAADPAMAAFIKRAGPYPERRGTGDNFATLAHSIVFQQLAGRAAAAIHARFVQTIGGAVTPEAVLSVDSDALRSAGLSTAKTLALIDLATKALDGTVPVTELDGLDDEEIITRLSAVRGIGRWTAEMFLMFELQRPDVWPVDDLGIRNGWTMIHELPALVKPRDLRQEGERFRPYRSVAAWYCWHAVHVARGDLVLPGSGA